MVLLMMLLLVITFWRQWCQTFLWRCTCVSLFMLLLATMYFYFIIILYIILNTSAHNNVFLQKWWKLSFGSSKGLGIHWDCRCVAGCCHSFWGRGRGWGVNARFGIRLIINSNFLAVPRSLQMAHANNQIINVQQPPLHPEVLAALVQLLFHDGAPHSIRYITSGSLWINQLLCLITLFRLHSCSLRKSSTYPSFKVECFVAIAAFAAWTARQLHHWPHFECKLCRAGVAT